MTNQFVDLADFPLTLKHIIVDCPDLQDTQLNYFTFLSVKDLFERVDHRNVIDFIFYFNCSFGYIYFIVAK